MVTWKPKHDVMPLSEFAPDKRAEIERLAAADAPPPRWLSLGPAQIMSRAWYEWHVRRGLNPDRRETMSPKLRAAVIARDGHICHLCGGDVERHDVHVDHVKPRSLGGSDAIGNLKVAHSLCNMRKGNRETAS